MLTEHAVNLILKMCILYLLLMGPSIMGTLWSIPLVSVYQGGSSQLYQTMHWHR